MLQQISDYVFMGSLGLFVITVIIYFSGSGGESNYINAANTTGVQAITGSTLTDLQMNHDHKKMANPQQYRVKKLLKSYLFWISVTGLIASVVLTKI
ncbi:hypothetical protein GC102_31400 [Paenibacillus sp. LMG 31460]|uniref:Uncharacterized protein n=1 Tax=Paenibacillus germinis TaxID=2654979 RepID=A0ABX1ZE26_9BACL|nr:hypothetical protein [Paenibacillus germinis]NOU90218.1 hypothetical protein [Paenibacillus germinis]